MTAFSTIAELLEQLELDPQACLDTINPLIVLKNNDILNIPYQTEDYLISINTASREELMTLVGVKAKTADAIIAYRSNIGLFQTLEELMEVKGIGIKKFEKLKPLIKL
ncbi:hypothetical protein SDC9_124035 [bioreactor metagenome]|uniref:Helix-hairpin-helix DNA-binding motif class 1 domain-containing protein n=1 Tax=bioreactor metagenome TaxID=1076179 RepID=A0A645CJB4_9ZZZZ